MDLLSTFDLLFFTWDLFLIWDHLCTLDPLLFYPRPTFLSCDLLFDLRPTFWPETHFWPETNFLTWDPLFYLTDFLSWPTFWPETHFWPKANFLTWDPLWSVSYTLRIPGSSVVLKLSDIRISLQPERTRTEQQTITIMFSCTPKMTKMWLQIGRKHRFSSIFRQ